MDLNQKLNQYLANQQVMYIKLHNLHWYVQGSSFFALHTKFEELYDVTADIIDNVAERILALGGSPVASVKKALEMSQVEELDGKVISSKEAISELVSDTEYWIKDTSEIIRLANDQNDSATAGVFDGYLAEYQKLLWMLKAFQA